MRFLAREMFYPGVNDYKADRVVPRSGPYAETVAGIILHATPGGSSSGAMEVMRTWQFGGRPARRSWHWLIPAEGEPQHGHFAWGCACEGSAALHTDPALSHPAINAGKADVNDWSMAIELVDARHDRQFTDWQLRMAASVTRYVWAAYPKARWVAAIDAFDPASVSALGPLFPWDVFRAHVLEGTALPEQEQGHLLTDLPPAVMPVAVGAVG